MQTLKQPNLDTKHCVISTLFLKLILNLTLSINSIPILEIYKKLYLEDSKAVAENLIRLLKKCYVAILYEDSLLNSVYGKKN